MTTIQFSTREDLGTDAYNSRVAEMKSFGGLAGAILTEDGFNEVMDRAFIYVNEVHEHVLVMRANVLMANLAINHATMNTNAARGYAIGASFAIDLHNATQFFRIRDEHLRENLTPETRAFLQDVTLNVDADGLISWGSPYDYCCTDPLEYALRSVVNTLYDDGGTFALVGPDVSHESQKLIHDTLVWLSEQIGFDVVQDRLEAEFTLAMDGTTWVMTGPFVIDHFDDEGQFAPFELPCVSRFFADPTAPFVYTEINEPEPVLIAV